MQQRFTSWFSSYFIDDIHEYACGWNYSWKHCLKSRSINLSTSFYVQLQERNRANEDRQSSSWQISRNVISMDDLHALGLGISYQRILGITKNLYDSERRQYERDGVLVPCVMQKNIFTIFTTWMQDQLMLSHITTALVCHVCSIPFNKTLGQCFREPFRIFQLFQKSLEVCLRKILRSQNYPQTIKVIFRPQFELWIFHPV